MKFNWFDLSTTRINTKGQTLNLPIFSDILLKNYIPILESSRQEAPYRIVQENSAAISQNWYDSPEYQFSFRENWSYIKRHILCSVVKEHAYSGGPTKNPYKVTMSICHSISTLHSPSQTRKNLIVGKAFETIERVWNLPTFYWLIY